MSETEKGNNNKPFWEPAVEIFTQVSTWIVVPILVAIFVGKGLDAHYGTRPIIFLVFAGIGFLFTCFGIVRVIRKYMQEIKDLSEKK